MGDIVSLHQEDETVQVLEAMLAAAKKGHLEGFAIILLKHKHGLEVTRSSEVTPEQENRLLAGIARLYRDLLDE